MIPSAILFDLDDTILSCEGGDYLKLWMRSVEKHIHLFQGLTPDSLFGEVRAVAEDFWGDPERHRRGRLDILVARQNIVSKAASNLGASNLEASKLLANHYHDRREFNVTPFEGALETLSYFRNTSIKTALVTNGSADVQRSKINSYQLEKYFDYVLIEGEFGMGKPHPKVYESIVRELKVSPASSWIVGDNLEWEVRVPQELGFFAIWNDHLGRGLPENSKIVPDKIVNSIYELIGMVS